jgi:linoleoyl-CoA desaturase
MRIRFKNKSGLNFYATVRSEVDNYFSENKISKQGNIQMALKIFIILSSFTALYGTIVFADIALYFKLPLAILFGAVTALIGLNICHDAIHGALSEKKWVNKTFAVLFNVVGANAYVWHITHNIVHHTFTNIVGTDEDLEIAPGIIRVHHTEEWKPIHKYQHYYAFLLYGLASLSWVFRKDFVKFFKKTIGNYDNSKPPAFEIVNLIFFKLVYVIIFMVIPLFFMNITILQFAVGFIMMHIAKGYTLALVFHPAHAVDNAEFPEPDEKGNIEEEWANHQLKTTCNFATNNSMITWLTGGLNRQVEHHLFPNICHIHYPSIAPIVKEVANKFDLPYLEHSTFFQALKAHYLLLKKHSLK